jgi:hypothetical protein
MLTPSGVGGRPRATLTTAHDRRVFSFEALRVELRGGLDQGPARPGVKVEEATASAMAANGRLRGCCMRYRCAAGLLVAEKNAVQAQLLGSGGLREERGGGCRRTCCSRARHASEQEPSG